MNEPKNDRRAMRVAVLRASELEEKHLAAWTEFVRSDPMLLNPLFSPRYAFAVSRVVSEVRVGVVEDGVGTAAFLPFERTANGIGKRLHLCDYQGLIARAGAMIDIPWFIRGCGLRAWDFDHLLARQSCFAPYHQGTAASPIMDLSAGYEAYVAERRAAGTEQIKKSGNLMRRLEREIGPLRLEVHVPDHAVLRQLLTWRWSKYSDSRHPFERVVAILEQFLDEQSPGCRGTLSVLYAADEIAACHFGLRSERVWHYWFPAYNPRFEKYSPGNILLLKVAEEACRQGITSIDLGRGEQEYKKRFMNGAIPLAEGSVEVSPLLFAMRSVRRGIGCLLSRNPRITASIRNVFFAKNGSSVDPRTKATERIS